MTWLLFLGPVKFSHRQSQCSSGVQKRRVELFSARKARVIRTSLARQRQLARVLWFGVESLAGAP